ncbi:MAG: DNA-binding protein, partial [Myxococcota bacterium]
PQTITTGEVDEDVEGRLVKVSGTVTRMVEDDRPYGIKVYVDDGSGETQIFVHLIDDAPIAPTDGLVMGDLVEAVGLGAQFEETYEVNPRGEADLIEIPVDGD